MSDPFTFPSSLHLVLSRLHHRWPARDTSTSLCATPRPCSPWRSPTISGRCWRRTWSGRSTRRTRCRCRTLTKTWPTYRRGRTASRTPTARAMFINVSPTTTHTLTHTHTLSHTQTHTSTPPPPPPSIHLRLSCPLIHSRSGDKTEHTHTHTHTHTHAAELPLSSSLSPSLSHTHILLFRSFWRPQQDGECTLWTGTARRWPARGSPCGWLFKTAVLCLYINVEIILVFRYDLEHVAPSPLPSPHSARQDSTANSRRHTRTESLDFPAKIGRMITFVLFFFFWVCPRTASTCTFMLT